MLISELPIVARCSSARRECSAGYFKEEEKTRETLTEDGYVKTGDAGFFDNDGQLKIIDRAKDVGKLSDGSLFAPKYIENKLKFYPNIKEAVAIGDGRDMATCFINIDLTSVGNWAERNNISYASYQELAGLDQGLRHDRGTCGRGEPVAGIGADDGRRPDPPVPGVAQGT